jgi:hypothetical protein
MKQIIIIPLIAIMSLTAISCATRVEFAQTGNIYPPYNGPVKVLENLPTDLPYEEIGWVSAEGDWNNPWAEMITKMQEKAASKGANAIVLVATNYPQSWGYRRSGERSIVVRAIRILDREQ